MNIIKKSLFTLATVTIIFCIVEIAVGYLLWINKSGVISTTYYAARKYYYSLYPHKAPKTIYTAFHPRSPYVPDEYLGYSNLPGVYVFELLDRNTGNNHSFTATINENGNRITSFAPELFEGKKEIWIFGDSYTYGWGNNDETTFPFFLQQFLPHFRIVNYADNGYGNVHAYLQIKREIKKNTLPKIIVIVYGNYFNKRNVAAPSRLKQYKYNPLGWKTENLSAYLHPRASINNGELKIDYVPLFWNNNMSNEKDPSEEYQHEVTKKILSEIYSIGKKNGVKMMLAFINGNDSDEVISFSRKIGYSICDIRPKIKSNEMDTFPPFDGHPGPLGQNHYAIKLYKGISEVISNNK
jgi:hypothetical protein